MQEPLTFPSLQQGSPPRFSFPELLPHTTEYYVTSACCSELSSSTSTPFVSAPSSPSRGRAFYFSAPASPSWPPAILQSPERWGFDFPYQHSVIGPPPDAHQPSGQLRRSAFVNGERISCSADTSLQAEDHSCSNETEQYVGSYQKAHHPSSSSIWAQQPFQAESTQSSSWSPKVLHSSQIREKISSATPLQAFQTEHHKSSPVVPQKPHQTEHERSPCQYWPQGSLETEDQSSTNSSPKPLQIHHGRSPSCSQQRTLQQDAQIEHLRNPSSLQSEHSRAVNSSRSEYPQPTITNQKLLKRLQVEDSDTFYSRKSFYASAVPFSWEEKPGTPRARSVTSEASTVEGDSPSNLLSGSSEFEFSARFSELEDPPMSPTPISSPLNLLKQQYVYGGVPSLTPELAYHRNPGMQNESGNEEQIWPLRPPPRLDNPVPWKQPKKNEGNELKCSDGSLAPLSQPQSPRSPRRFDIRGALCGILSPVDAVFDPFLTAMEKSMAKNGDELAFEETEKGPKKKANKYNSHGLLHRRTQSLSPLRVFHWDDHSTKSNSSSNGSSNMDEVKNKHPIHREINARHSAGTSKGLKKWSFKGFLHRKSVSGAESVAQHSNMSVSQRSSGRESFSSRRVANGERPIDNMNPVEDKVKTRGTNSPSVVASRASISSSILSPSSSNNSSEGKLRPNKSSKGTYAYHYGVQRAHTEDLRKKTFLPYKQGLLGCLGLSSKSYRALTSLSKPLQSVS